ncbi:Acyl-CoA dehydrogenase, putative [Perkinsus marinus ATCC 50983]|uniref:Acyl-CoA dehydrogenase, putative n=1 Tax=Perkinsus marinus (strain ATCC 50983 / TXsc) TaxID=423536 RepID=C5KK11_PERM5|nr:Acyl-CoA dehydrogenase, putative [Perkinsus marinus ATCC 50983]EER15269.1 Acyl-CoA dehydrogenase, putative [Perkinsus marinus ATCC 50983]|eukprot:XP_002783473.1 Acyl-CoA dehydrogenase, putative [Perkinsus marinus ATCC 50983]
MPVVAKETFGSPVPYAEPSWYTKGHSSPYYTQSHVEWRARCRKFVEDEVMPNVSEWEKEKAIPMEIYAKCYRAGLLPSLVGPKGYDYADPAVAAKPQGFDYFHELIFIDELCRCGSGGVMWGMMGGLNIGLPTVLNFGTSEMKARVAPPCVRGEKNICLCITEPHAGSDVANIRTTAKLTPDGKHYIVNGQKKWITNGIFSDYFSVAVRTGGSGMKGISMLLVERGMPGLKTTRLDCQGVLSSGTTFVEFDDVKVPVENLIGKENDGFKVIMYNFNHERWGLIIQAVRFSRILYELSFKYAQKRKTFGKTLMEHP